MPHHHHPTVDPELQRPRPSTSRAILVALSGPSCSGKTTLARLLRDALAPHAFILHEDDFYLTDAEIPVKKVADGRELQDWDCLESLDVDGLGDMLAFIKREGRVKDGFESKEDKNSVGNVKIDADVVRDWKDRFTGLAAAAAATTTTAEGEAVHGTPPPPRIAIIDGFLLFAEAMQRVRDTFDLRLLLRLDRATVKRRREARSGYVTLEGFWEDPAGYVDLIVWPNYVKDHAFLFERGDVEAELDAAVAERLAIHAMPKDAVDDMTRCFEWAAGMLYATLKAIAE